MNRVYLLITTFFALLIPIGLFIDLSSFFEDDIIIPMVNVHDYIDIPIVFYAQQRSSLYLMDVLKWIYIVGLLGSISIMLWRLWHVQKMFISDAPFLGFSFFNKMYLGREVKSYQSIERHEQIHIEQGHSYDVLFMEVFKVLNWFNPLVYHMSKEIKFQHECIADELSSDDKVAYAELLVAHALQVPKNVLVNEFSNQSFLKKRIMMLFKNKSSKNKRFLYLGIIPAVLVVGLSTVVFNTSRAKSVIAKVESRMENTQIPLDYNNENPTLIQPTQLESIRVVTNNVTNDTIKEGGDELFTVTEILPEPPGGMKEFLKWIGNNYEFPQEAIDAGVKGSILTSFIVEKDGSLSNLKVTRDLSYNTGRRAIDVLKRSPKWSPAIQNGRKVRYEFNLPIRLDLTGMNDNSGSSQDTLEGKRGGKITKINEGNEIFSQVEIQPEPPGGMNAYRKWIGDNYQYPKAAIDAEVKGTVQITFVVEKDGLLSDIKAVRDLGHGTGESAVNVLKTSPKWSPGIQNGKPVRVAYVLPIRIDLSKGGKGSQENTRVEIIAEPSGGVPKFREFLATHYEYPKELFAKKTSGNVEVEFEIDTEGNPINITIRKETHKNIGQQLESLIKKNGTWHPAILNGKKTKFAFSMTINLKYAEGVGTIEVKNLKPLGFIKS
ncbi:energy transducer TonB [Sphingobacterium composti Ten et al. 2007 non Yoo et al. 2007]|uniref:energy transducer TonB n=1 Tax=Sphingobacterium composti TaxID=363260 RepID=UPI001356AF2C|nr:energy transducer TonB [Sphingobacterium composti Ten et al. 2007 non Yoo et al. 2007]